LMAASQFDDAVHVWQDFIKSYPNDIDGPINLGNCLNRLKRYSEAAAAYQAAEKLGGDHDNLEALAGIAYLNSGDREKAGTIFAAFANANPKGNIFNDVAYEMADSDFSLSLALNYAQRAVTTAEQESEKIRLPELKIDDLNHIFALSSYWDTLGWVNERMSQLDTAEQYLEASWKLTQEGAAAGHLCQLYRRMQQTEIAIQACRAALYRLTTSNQAPDWLIAERKAAQETLDHLTRDADKSKAAIKAADFVVGERPFKLPRFLSGTESADFFVLFASDGKSKTFKVDDVKFISGSSKMKLQGKQLRSINFNFAAADDMPARFVRRGILGCYQYTGCSFVLLDPASVHSLN
jgi:tetratricopeptide (TPR) repeat protein